MQLTPDTLSHVNNESDDPRVQGIEETRRHMVKWMKHADSLSHSIPQDGVTFWFSLLHHLPPTQNLIFNLVNLVTSDLGDLNFPVSTYPSSVCHEYLSAGGEGHIGEKALKSMN